MNKVKKFLKDLRSSKSFKETLDIIIDFRASNGEMNVPEIIEMINIISENRQVFGVLSPWDNDKFFKNNEVREFISKYVDILIKNKKDLNQDTLNDLNRVFRTIYLSYLRAENNKEDVYLYHGNSVITSLSFILNKKLFSRKYGEDNAIPQTFQKSDDKDKEQDIYNDIFFDNSDIGEVNICAYGPITFVFSAEKIFQIDREIKVTKENPVKIEEINDMYFSGLSEIKKEIDEGKYKFYKQFNYHTTIKNCDYIELTKENLKYIIIENCKNQDEVIQLSKEYKVHSSIELKKMFERALSNVNLNEVEVCIRNFRENKFIPNMATDIEELWSSDLEVLFRKDK